MEDDKYINPYKLFYGVFVPNWLLKRKEISHGAKLCYGKLCQYAGENGDCYPSQETLAKELGVKSRRSIFNYIKELEKCQLIEKRRRGLTTSNIYRFLRHDWMEFRSDVKNLSIHDGDNDGRLDVNNHSHELNHLKEPNENNHINKSSKSLKSDFDGKFDRGCEQRKKYTLSDFSIFNDIYHGKQNIDDYDEYTVGTIKEHFYIYESYMGKKHPPIINEQMQDLLYRLDEASYIVLYRDMDDLVETYWKTCQEKDYDCDFNINHFVSWIEGLFKTMGINEA